MLRQLIWVCLQALKADLVPYLLKLLEGIGLENLESPSATKAQIVKTLKSMSRSLQYGEQVSTDLTVGFVHLEDQTLNIPCLILWLSHASFHLKR